jgi:peptidoglycan/LPS O-acetylase OafA/YrhL
MKSKKPGCYILSPYHQAVIRAPHVTIFNLSVDKSNPHLPALTGLRSLLALWVILHHLSNQGGMLDAAVRSLPAALQTLAVSGYWAVATFFVLSGFVLARTYAARRWDRSSLVRYGIARWARVYPVYFLSLLILAPIIFRDLVSFPQGRPLALRLSLLSNYALVLQGWTGNLPVQWNTPAWSLSCELFFYLCFPLAMLLAKRAGRRGTLVIATAGLALPILCRLLNVPDAAKPILHLGDFLVGIACAGIYEALVRSGTRLAGRGYWLYLPAAAGSAVVIAVPRIAQWIYLDFALRPLNALLLIGLALGGGPLARWLSTRIALLFGKASYSMYILHIPVLWWFKGTWFHRSAALPPEAAALIYIAIVLLVSALVFKLFEEPANRRLRDALSARFRSAPRNA